MRRPLIGAKGFSKLSLNKGEQAQRRSWRLAKGRTSCVCEKEKKKRKEKECEEDCF